MTRFVLKFAYDGSQFQGSQTQKNGTGVEDLILKTLKKTGLVSDRKGSNFQLASRTDAGVHALGNVLAFNTSKKVHLGQLNALTAPRVVFWALTETPNDFLPRHASSREYYYYAFAPKASEQEINSLAQGLLGDHSFHNFSNDPEKTNSTILKAQVERKGDFLVFYFKGTHFRRQQVRRMVQYLLRSKLEAWPSLEQLFDEGRKFPIPPSPPEGLVLIGVEYKGLEFSAEEKAAELLRGLFFEESVSAKRKALMLEYLSNSL